MPIEHAARPLQAGRKRVDVTLVIHTYEDVPEDWDDDSIHFYIEENHCHGNYLTRIRRDEDDAAKRQGLPESSGVCQLCSFSEAYVGHLPFPEGGEESNDKKETGV